MAIFACIHVRASVYVCVCVSACISEFYIPVCMYAFSGGDEGVDYGWSMVRLDEESIVIAVSRMLSDHYVPHVKASDTAVFTVFSVR